MSFTALGWFTLAQARKVIAPDVYDALREAIRFKEIAVTRFGNEYLLDDEVYRAWLERASCYTAGMRFDLRFVLFYVMPYVALAALLLGAAIAPESLTLRRWSAAGLLIVAALICRRLTRMK